MFVDTAKVKVEAGKGGDGAVSFRHEIYIPKGGPDGGDGGRGGSVIFVADKDTNTLLDFRYNPILKAASGKNGSGTRSAGRSGEDLIVEVPIGTVVKRDGEVIADLTHDREKAVIAKGGSGGFGNAHFVSSTRQAPLIAEVGEPGEAFEAELELKLLADVGLVGLPNAGKSTFLSVVTNAKPEIADYPFTTITPNLGVATIDRHDILIADIPGLIEGAAEGKGLGHAFLRHVDRTAVLLHLVDVYNDDAGAAYKIIRDELEKYSDLASRPEIVALTKCEGLDSDIIELQKSSILKVNPGAKIFAISSSAHQGLDELLRELVRESSNADGSSEGYIAESSSELPNADGSSGGYIAESSSEVPNRFGHSETYIPDDAGTASSGMTSKVSKSHEEELSQYRYDNIPTIKLSTKELADAWHVEREGDKFIVTGAKIEKFARRTDLNNYASLNRLRDIMKKLGIRAELTTQGAKPDSIISIAGKEFPLVENW